MSKFDMSKLVQNVQKEFKNTSLATKIGTGNRLKQLGEEDFLKMPQWWIQATNTPGLPYGTGVVLAGRTDSGKTTGAIEAMKAAQAIGAGIIYAETENKTTEIQSEYDLALASLKDGNFSEAEEKFANFIQNHKDHKLRENAVFWYAESFYRQGNFNQAAIHYLKGYKEYTTGSKASDSLLKLSLSLGKLKKQKEACVILDKLETEFPKRSADSLKRAAEARANFNCKK